MIPAKPEGEDGVELPELDAFTRDTLILVLAYAVIVAALYGLFELAKVMGG